MTSTWTIHNNAKNADPKSQPANLNHGLETIFCLSIYYLSFVPFYGGGGRPCCRRTNAATWWPSSVGVCKGRKKALGVVVGHSLIVALPGHAVELMKDRLSVISRAWSCTWATEKPLNFGKNPDHVTLGLMVTGRWAERYTTTLVCFVCRLLNSNILFRSATLAEVCSLLSAIPVISLLIWLTYSTYSIYLWIREALLIILCSHNRLWFSMNACSLLTRLFWINLSDRNIAICPSITSWVVQPNIGGYAEAIWRKLW